MKKPIPPKGDNPAALEKYNKEFAAWKRQATAWEIRQHEHDSRYGRQEKLFGKTTSYTDPRDYARRNFKLSTTGDTKGLLVDIGNNNALVTKEYKAKLYDDIANFERAQSSEFSARNRERLFGTRTPFIDEKISSKKSYINRLNLKKSPLDRLRSVLSKRTAEGGKVFDFNRAEAIKKEEAKLSDLQADRLKIQNPKAYNKWIAPSKSGMDLGGNFEDLQFDTTNYYNIGDKTVEQDINWYKTPTKDGEANVIDPNKVNNTNNQGVNTTEGSSETSSKAGDSDVNVSSDDTSIKESTPAITGRNVGHKNYDETSTAKGSAALSIQKKLLDAGFKQSELNKLSADYKAKYGNRKGPLQLLGIRK